MTTPNKATVKGVVDMERYQTKQAIKAICDIEGFNLHQMVTYIVDQRTQAHQQGEREERERCIKVLTDQGYISEKGIQKKIDMKHGSCCCCTDCGHWHDECICESNDLIKALTEVNND